MTPSVHMPIYSSGDVPPGLHTRNQWEQRGRRVKGRKRDARAKVRWNDWRVHLYSIDQTEKIVLKRRASVEHARP